MTCATLTSWSPQELHLPQLRRSLPPAERAQQRVALEDVSLKQRGMESGEQIEAGAPSGLPGRLWMEGKSEFRKGFFMDIFMYFIMFIQFLVQY